MTAVITFAARRANNPEPEYVIETPEPEPEPIPEPAPPPEPPPPPEPTQIIEKEPEPEPEDTGAESPFINNLTGLPIAEELVNIRPVGVMINNRHIALPQSGISQADILYEVIAEGGITRFIVFFKDFDSERIGPVRSTRDYYGSIALENDAVFVHHGGSDGGYIFIKSNGLDAIDGMRDTLCFWRDPERSRIPSMLEHSSYTNAERIKDAIERNEFRTEYDEDIEFVRFDFYKEPTAPASGKSITSVTVPYSNSQTPEFVYDEETGLFSRFQAGGEHIDEETGEQLTCSNIIIQFTTMRVIDNAGRHSVDLVGKGEGYIVTNGAYAPITWEKKNQNAPTEYFNEDNEPLKLNKGKTWIMIVPPSADIGFNDDTPTDPQTEEQTDGE